MPRKNNLILAKNLLPLMQGAGKSIINNTATTDSFAKHIQEVTALGYDGSVHGNFSEFICKHLALATVDKVRWVGEILVDWIVLDTARCLTTKDYGYTMSISEDEFRDALSFQPPAFHLIARPYTEVAKTFWRLSGFGCVERLILGGQYDDIFNKILLWRTYGKEPFHDYRRELNIRSVDDFINLYLIESIHIQPSSMSINSLWNIAVKFFSKEENVKKFLKHQNKIFLDGQRQSINEAIKEKNQLEQTKQRIQKEKEEKTKIHEQNRLRKLKESVAGQKRKSIVLKMLDGKTYERGTAAGNRAAWLCLCGDKTILIGRTYGPIPQRKSVVVCQNCQKRYYLSPLNGKPNKPPEKIMEISINHDFK